MRRWLVIKARIVVAILGVAMMLLAGTLVNRTEVSADAASCLSSSGASNVESVQNACNLCTKSSTLARGTLWINGSDSERNSNTIDVKYTEENSVIDIYLWGQVYSCGQATTASNTAHHIWIGREGQMIGSGSNLQGAVDYIKENNAQKSLYRGTGTGKTQSWYSPLGQHVSMKLDVQKFKTDSGTQHTTEQDPTYGTVEVYRAKVSINRCFKKLTGGYVNQTGSRSGTCYGDDSEIVLRILPVGDDQFISKSKVTADSGSSESASWGVNAADLEVQADEDGKATVAFAHQLRYASGMPNGTYEEAYTQWTIKTDLLARTESETWRTPGGVTKETDWFTTGNKELKVEVQLGEGETEKRVCSTISYQTKTVKWDTSSPHKMLPVNDTGNTQACAVVRKTPKQNTGGIVFWPQSSVESVAERDVVNHKEWTTDDKNKADGDIVSMQLSTDYNQAKANFEHKIHVDVDLGEYTVGANDTWDATNMCTEYWVNYADGTTSPKEKFCTPKLSSGSSTTSGEKSVPGRQGFTINVEGKVIEKLNYKPKTISVKREELKTNACYNAAGEQTASTGCSWNPARYKYYAEENSGSGEGYSSAEIEYVSPNEPDDSNGPSSGSGVSGQPMYAGETTSMTWWARAKAIDTRRIAEIRSVAFEVLWDFNYNEVALSGDLDKNLKYSDNPGRSQYDPCGYWRNRLDLRANMTDCTLVNPGDSTLNNVFGNGYVGEHLMNSISQLLVVPDHVGDKYCNSFAYKWQYYWGVKRKSSGDQWVWTPENQTYWTHYDAACRTIAKKPSVAVWNGGVFTNGGIMTSLAPRYNNTAIGTLATTANAAYGSWTEHLGVANGLIQNFGTGGSLAFGSGALSVSNSFNSPLTIRNDLPILGMASINNNSALVSRLGDYLGNLESVERFDGDTLEISSNYTMPATSYSDIYQLPQQVIYAPKATKINISGNVTLIDAWIIAPNATIDTCADFSEDSTETRPAMAHACDQPLRINGPVIASALELNRTGGADITNVGDRYTDVFGPIYSNAWEKYTPAEVFNLSAATYLWAYAQAGRYGSSYTESYTRELPPRY